MKIVSTILLLTGGVSGVIAFCYYAALAFAFERWEGPDVLQENAMKLVVSANGSRGCARRVWGFGGLCIVLILIAWFVR
jgi:hypothetical protein